MDKMNVIEREKKYMFQIYNRQPVVIVKGEGSKVWDIDGKEYIDCVSGIAVCSVGHRNPVVVKKIKDQLDRLMHISNLYYTDVSVDVAENIAKISGMDKVFFCNSGTESIEAALKLAIKHTGKNKFIAMKNAFHGRTIGALSVTYKEKFKKPFESFLNGACFVDYGDASKIEENIDKDTAAIILEPIQGESGVIVPPDGYLREVRDICDKNDLLFIIDEVQTGFGRTGKWFAFQHEGITPDIITMAKGMGDGFPVGAMAAKEEVADSFKPGDHGTTFGGNPLACSAVLGVIETINKGKLIEKSEKDGRYFKEKLTELQKDVDFIEDVRGKGMMIGLSLKKDANSLVSSVMNKGALINAISDRIIRLVPPFVITRDEIDQVVSYIAD